MNQRRTAKVFLGSKMGRPGTQYHTYRHALINLIETEYPFLHVDAFEDTASAGHYKSWEISAIKNSNLFIGLIVDDRDEVKFEIEQAIAARNPILLFFFPHENRAPETWKQFAKLSGIKANRASTWRELIDGVRDSLDEWIIGSFNESKGKVDYSPPQPMERI